MRTSKPLFKQNDKSSVVDIRLCETNKEVSCIGETKQAADLR